MMLQVTWQLMHLCIVAVATLLPGSSGFSESVSLETSSPVAVIEARVPNPITAQGPLLNGPTVQPPIVSPSVKAPPSHQGPLPFLSPRESNTLPPQHGSTTSTSTQTPHGWTPPLSAEPPYNPDFPTVRAPQGSNPAPVAGLVHGLPPSASTAEPPYYSTPPPNTPSVGTPHASAFSPAAKPLGSVPELASGKSPEALPLASHVPPPEASLHNSTMQSPPIPTEAPVSLPQPLHTFALPLPAKPPESKPPLPAAEPPIVLTLTSPTEAPPVLPLLPPETPPRSSDMSSSPPQPVPSSAPPSTSTVPSNLLPPTMAPPSTLPSPFSPPPSNVFSPPPQVPPTVSSPTPQPKTPIVLSPPTQAAPPTVSSPPPQLVPPIVSTPPQLVPPIVSAPPPKLSPSIVSSPPPQLNPPLVTSPPPQQNQPTVSSPPPQLVPPILSAPPPKMNPPIVSSPPLQLNPPMVSFPPSQKPMISSPPPQQPTVSSPPPELSPSIVSSPPQSNPPTLSSPPPELSPPIVTSPPPELNPPIVSSPPPKLDTPIVSSPPPKLDTPIVSSPPPKLDKPIVSSPPPELNPPIVSSPPPELNPPMESSPAPKLDLPSAPSPLTQLIPPPAFLPNPAVPSNASVPPPLIVSPPDLSSPPIAIPPRASAILSAPLPSHAMSPNPMPHLPPQHVLPAPPPSELPLTPRSSTVPRSDPPHPSPTPLPTSPVHPSRPYAPPPSKPSHSSVPPSPVMKQIVPASPPKSSHLQEDASPPSITNQEPSPPLRPLPEAAPPAHRVTPRSNPPSSHQIESPKHSPFLRSNTSGPFKPKVERHNSTAPAPFSFREHPANNGSHHSLRHSPVKGSPPATTPLPSHPEVPEISFAPLPLPRAPPGHSGTPFLSPKISPSRSSTRNTKRPPTPPIRSLPPPPPNADCAYLTCREPLTNTPPGSPCGCVWPMQVGLRLSVALYTFFPLVSELSREIAAGVFMKQSQVRVMGANLASDQSEKTIALVDLVPLSEKFDNGTSYLIFQRFWHKQVVINKSVFGDYDILYVHYPGLPPSPPMAPADMAVINGMPYSVRDPNQSTLHPLGVDVTKQKDKHKLSGIAIVAIVFSALVGVLVCCSVAWVLVFRHKNLDVQPTQTPRALPSLARSSAPTGNSAGSGPGSSVSVESSLGTYTGSAKTFSTSEIERATDNLNPSRVIGEGGFGLVYGGVLEDETNVAVKVLKRDDQQGGREFLAEVEMLSRLHHRNLVKLIGICTDERLRCLVYELIPNGSVDSHLHGTDKEIAPLDWSSRMKIALGAARGLAYLHEDSSPRVIHRDFKSSNILLESDLTPKVSDFGLARSAMDGESKHISTRVMGTFGYVAPEYAMTGHLLVKSDVYSYGVVLLELLTGRKPVDMSQPPGQENLVAWTRPFLTTKEGLELILDPSLGSDLPLDSVVKVAAIASMCVQPEVSHRPFMGEVVQALKLVCNECDDSRDGDSSLGSPENLSVDFEAKTSSVSETKDYLPIQLSLQKYFPTYDVEKGVSVSENLRTTTQVDRQSSNTFRRKSASGPLKTVRGLHFWQRIGRQSNGSVSEHGVMYRLWTGSH